LRPSDADLAIAPAPDAQLRERLPDFFLVGQAKSGTSALDAMLRRHPQVFTPAGKEPRYFATDLYERRPPRPEGTPTTMHEYARLFAGARPEQRVGESSAQYLWSRTAAAGIAEACPDARIVAVFREPASFLRSLHYQFVETYIEVESDFRRALELEPERRQGRQLPPYTYWPQMLLYSDHVRYVEQLRRFSERFAPEQLLVLTYDDFRADNEAVVRQVLRFIGVDDEVAVESLEVNPTVRVRSPRMHELLHALSVGRGPASLRLKATLKSVLPRRLRKRVLSTMRKRLVYGEPEPPDEQLMAQLRRRYKPEVVALSEQIGRDLVSLWGYDSID
jgi:Sulfotransferase family